MRYSVDSRTTAGGQAVFTLRDDATGASASVLPAVGFNLFDLRLPIGGRLRSVIATQPGWEDLPERPTRQGIPVLFPFPNRIRDGRYSWNGRAYTLPLNKPPHAIHGFAVDAAWGDVSPLADDTAASIAARFWLGRDASQRRPFWPEDAVLIVRYSLADGALHLEADIENPGRVPLPWGLGLHAYFHLPFDENGDPGRTRIVIPARSFWELDESLPTGRVLPVDAAHDFQKGRNRLGLAADDVLTDLTPDADGWTSCRMIDDNLGAEVRLRCDPGTREVVVFTPPAYPRVIAVEPYTQTTDAVNLAARGIDAGLNVLAPGRTAVLRYRVETSG
jgi:aldose 1-epimerase